MSTIPSFTQLPDAGLVAEIGRLVGDECRATATLVAALAEFDARRLWLPLGYSSLFAYCVQCLHLSEDAACSRIDVARASRKFPPLLAYLGRGDLSLTGARLLVPHLTEENHRRVLEEARHKSKRDIELLVARLAPQAPLPTAIRKLPEPKIAVALARADAAAPTTDSNGSCRSSAKRRRWFMPMREG